MQTRTSFQAKKKKKYKLRKARCLLLVLIIIFSTTFYITVKQHQNASAKVEVKLLETVHAAEAKQINNETEEIEEKEELPSSNKVEQEEIAKYAFKEVEICNSSSVKTYMSYKAITNTGSKQYKFIKSDMYVDQQSGLLRYNDDNEFIGVALGSWFGEIGTMWQFTLDTGVVLNLIKVEAKADQHTYNGCQQRQDTSVIEFVVDTGLAGNHFGWGGNGYVVNGNFNNISGFKGKIIKVEKVNKNY